jgi:hypothetical protein
MSGWEYGHIDDGTHIGSERPRCLEVILFWFPNIQPLEANGDIED